MNVILQPNGYAGVDGLFRFNAHGVAERQLAVAEANPKGMKIIVPAQGSFPKSTEFTP
jgi:hypothetical protein